MVNTWLFAHWHHRAITHLENVCQLNIKRGKKLSFQLSHRQPHNAAEELQHYFQITSKIKDYLEYFIAKTLYLNVYLKILSLNRKMTVENTFEYWTIIWQTKQWTCILMKRDICSSFVTGIQLVNLPSSLLSHYKDLNTFLIFEFRLLFFFPWKKVQNYNHDPNIKQRENTKI